jgi:1-acyl-sn-glycerol-3-phosphate acyltransferase
VFKLFCALICKLRGWKINIDIPADLRSFVLIGAPHTDNYDFVSAMALNYHLHRNSKFVIKKEWLRFPLSLFFKPLGAVGVDRDAIKNSKTMNSTDLIAELFKGNPEFVLMISPEGTRKPNNTWKTGFYYIAQKAGVPIVLGYADFKTKTLGVGKVIIPTNFEQDMAAIMEFYISMEGKIPANFVLDHRYIVK